MITICYGFDWSLWIYILTRLSYIDFQTVLKILFKIRLRLFINIISFLSSCFQFSSLIDLLTKSQKLISCKVCLTTSFRTCYSSGFRIHIFLRIQSLILFLLCLELIIGCRTRLLFCFGKGTFIILYRIIFHPLVQCFNRSFTILVSDSHLDLVLKFWWWLISSFNSILWKFYLWFFRLFINKVLNITISSRSFL